VSVVALVAILLIGVFPLPLIYQQSATALLSGLLIAGLSQHQFRLLATRPARWLGQRSYSIYLWHPFIGVILFYQFHVGDGFGMLVMVLLLSLITADMSYRWVESPLRNFGRRLSHRVGAEDPSSKPPQPILSTLPPRT
jgi:peptidoglycan/LPS O-acetylase OafA/YrhL